MTIVEKIFLWVGVVICAGIGVILILALLKESMKEFSEWLTSQRQKNNSSEYAEISVILGVKVPTSERKPYTPIGYIYSRKNKKLPPVVTIINAPFFKKLPDDTNLFVVSKDTRYEVQGIKTVKDLKRALTLYQKSVSSEGWG